MINRLLLASLPLACVVPASLPAAAQPTTAVVVATCGTPPFGYYPDANRQLTQDTTGKLCDGGGGAVSSNSTIVAPLGAQTSAASVATTINGALPAGTALLGKVGIDQTTPGTTNGVQAVGPLGTAAPSAGVSVTPTRSTYVSSSALAANQIIIASAHQLLSFDVAADTTLSGAAWWIMIYDATTAPVDGAVTPAKCYALPSGTTTFNAAFSVPLQLGTGIVIGVSTTGCFTKTASTHAFISGDYQ